MVEEKKGLSSDFLKIIAFVTMIIDHTGLILKGVLPDYLYVACRVVGRLSFPIFAYCVVEGFVHTSNYKKYIIRMWVLAFISELPFNLMTSGKWLYDGGANVLFTFAVALLVLGVFKWAEDKGMKGRISAYAAMSVAIVGTYFLHTDYSWVGIIFIVVMYCLRNMPEYKYVCGSVIMWLNGSLYNLAAPLAFVPIYFCNGRKGRLTKWITYSIYPLHMLVLGLIREVVIYG